MVYGSSSRNPLGAIYEGTPEYNEGAHVPPTRSITNASMMSNLSFASDDSTRMSYAMDGPNGSEMDFSISGSTDASMYRNNDGSQDDGASQGSGMQGSLQEHHYVDSNDQTSTNDEGRSWIFGYKYGERYVTEQGKERIRCKVGNCTKTYSSIKKTTTTFITHLRNSHGITEFTGPHAQQNKRGGPLDSFLAKRTRTFDQNEFHQQFIKFLVSGKLPFTTSENKQLQQLLEMAQTAPTMAAVKLPNADTFTRKTTMEYHAYYEKVKTTLRDLPAISCTLDCWTSPFNQAFLGVTGHWICEKTWIMHDIMLGFEPLDGPHTSENLASAFITLLDNLGLGAKLFTITTDNASNMEKMAELLQAHSQQDNGWSFEATRRIPCVGHVINLAVQEIIKKGFLSEAPADIMDVEDDLRDTTTLAKLRKGILKIRSSPQRSAVFERKRIAMECPHLKLTLDVRTRWNSTYDMLNRALKLKEAYIAMTANGDLKDYALEGDEWDRVEHMCKLLEPFEHATRMLSASKSHTTVNMTILSYNRLIDKLEDFADIELNPTCPQDLREAAKAGREKLLPYYGRTDDTEVYAVATAMDPRMRFDWWTRSRWEKKIQDDSEELVRETWSKFSGMVPIAPEISEQAQALHDLFLLEPSNDELNEYVGERSLTPMVTKDRPQELLFWESSAIRWPNLSRMAARYLAIPATSTPSERCFSATRLMLPHTRNRLAPDTIKQLMLLGSWQSFFDGIHET